MFRKFYASSLATSLSMLFLLFLFPAPMPGQQDDNRPLPPGISLSTKISPEEPVEGDYITYQVVVRGNADVQQYDYPEWNQVDGLRLTEGPNRKIFVLNGNVMQVQEFQLMATKSGKINIPPTEVKINGYWYNTQPSRLEVRKVSAGDAGIEGVLPPRVPSQPQYNESLRGNYFARAEIPEDVYQGQAVPVTIYVYRNPENNSFRQYDIPRDAEGDDFLFPDPQRRRNAPRSLNWEEVSFGNRQYVRAPLHTFYVVPTKSGELQLTPPLIRVYFQVEQRRHNRRGLDSFFSFSTSQMLPVELPLRAMQIDVQNPPPKPDEAIFQIVGEAQARVEVDRRELQRRELLTLRLGFAGKSYLDLLSEPDLGEIPKLTLLDTKSNSESVLDNDELLSKKDFEFVYQAVDEGEVTIPSFSFAMFNPETGSQRLVESDPIDVQIHPADADSVLVGGSSSGNGEESSPERERAQATELQQDVSYIDATPLTTATILPRKPFYVQPWFWLLQLVPLGLAFGVGLAQWRKRVGPADQESSRKRRSRRAMKAALREANNKIESAGREDFYATLSNAIMNYVAAMLGRTAYGLTVEEASEELRRRGRPPESCDQLQQLLHQFDTIRYSPAPDEPENRRQALQRTEEILGGLEREASHA